MYQGFNHVYKQAMGGPVSAGVVPSTYKTLTGYLNRLVDVAKLIQLAVCSSNTEADVEDMHPVQLAHNNHIARHAATLRIETSYEGLFLRDCVTQHERFLDLLEDEEQLFRVRYVKLGTSCYVTSR
jgi:hypothetical protein